MTISLRRVPDDSGHFTQTVSIKDADAPLSGIVPDFIEQILLSSGNKNPYEIDSLIAPREMVNKISTHDWQEFVVGLLKNYLSRDLVPIQFKKELLLSRDRMDPHTTMRVLPVEGLLRMGWTHEVSGKICLVDLDFPLNATTQASVEALCVGAKAGLSLMPQNPGIHYGKKAGFVDIEISNIPEIGDNCKKTYFSKLGIGSAGSEFQISPHSVQGYLGLGPVGAGGGIVSSCDQSSL